MRIFFKLFLAIPQLIVIELLLVPLWLLTFLAWFAILFTGRYPRGFFEFTTGVLRWATNVVAYLALLRDEYPPFSWEPGDYPLTLDIPIADRQSRFRLFIRAIAIFPNWLVFYFVQIGWFFTTFVAWWAILITGRYPRGLFKFSVGVMRWWNRQYAYLLLLRDEYPPYSVNANARPGNEAASFILGIPLLDPLRRGAVAAVHRAARERPADRVRPIVVDGGPTADRAAVGIGERRADHAARLSR